MPVYRLLADLNGLLAGSYFGGLALLRPDQPPQRTATVIALEAAETLSVTVAPFHRLCSTHPRVEHLLTMLLARRSRGSVSGCLVNSPHWPAPPRRILSHRGQAVLIAPETPVHTPKGKP